MMHLRSTAAGSDSRRTRGADGVSEAALSYMNHDAINDLFHDAFNDVYLVKTLRIVDKKVTPAMWRKDA